MLRAERAQLLGVMDDRGGVDHAETEPPAAPAAYAVGPVGEVVGQSEHLAGVCDDRLRAGRTQPSASVAVEQRDTESTLEFGQPLRQRRRAHPDPLGGERPGRLLGDRDEVLELPDRQVGEWLHPSQDTSVCFTVMCSNE